MRIENTEVYGFRRAFYGMRAPLDSWDKSDSKFFMASDRPDDTWDTQGKIFCVERPQIGPGDMALAQKLIKGGSEHRKFLRTIQVWFDITIPRYVWQELDTYKVATVRNSCSTMHKLGSRDLTQDDFELPIPVRTLELLNAYGKALQHAKVDKDIAAANAIRREYKNLLPEGYLQKASYLMNYETAMTMYFQRKSHRLPEWKLSSPESICSFIYHLPHMPEFLEADKRYNA